MFFEENWQTLTPREPVDRETTRFRGSTSPSSRIVSSPRSSASGTRARTRASTSSAGSAGRRSSKSACVPGRGAVAFAMFPTQISDVMAIADAGVTMPPKSTWFEPKLRSGLFVHRF